MYLRYVDDAIFSGSGIAQCWLQYMKSLKVDDVTVPVYVIWYTYLWEVTSPLLHIEALSRSLGHL